MRNSRLTVSAAIAALSLALGLSAASAADLPARAYSKVPEAVVSPIYSWTGFYIGANGGYGWGSNTANYTPNDPAAFLGTCSGTFGSTCIPPASLRMSGGLAGGQAGYNWQVSPQWLVGVETDIDWARIQGSGNSAFFLGSYGPGVFTASETVNWFGTLRARVGFIPTAPLLLYGTGGLAYGNVSKSAVMPGPNVGIGVNLAGGFGYACGTATGMANCFNGSSSQTKAGWTVGAGGEYMFTNNLSLKAEYLYVNLGRSSVTPSATLSGGLLPASFNTSIGSAFNVVRVGLNYKFGG
jgi:outer membrane immunogenic protein